MFFLSRSKFFYLDRTKKNKNKKHKNSKNKQTTNSTLKKAYNETRVHSLSTKITRRVDKRPSECCMASTPWANKTSRVCGTEHLFLRSVGLSLRVGSFLVEGGRLPLWCRSWRVAVFFLFVCIVFSFNFCCYLCSVLSLLFY